MNIFSIDFLDDADDTKVSEKSSTEVLTPAKEPQECQLGENVAVKSESSSESDITETTNSPSPYPRQCQSRRKSRRKSPLLTRPITPPPPLEPSNLRTYAAPSRSLVVDDTTDFVFDYTTQLRLKPRPKPFTLPPPPPLEPIKHRTLDRSQPSLEIPVVDDTADFVFDHECRLRLKPKKVKKAKTKKPSTPRDPSPLPPQLPNRKSTGKSPERWLIRDFPPAPRSRRKSPLKEREDFPEGLQESIEKRPYNKRKKNKKNVPSCSFDEW